MSTSRTIDNLNIRKFSNKAAFDSATIGEDDICVLLDDGTPLMYTTTLPEPSASVVNAVYYLISDYQGQARWYQGQRIYKCIFDGSNYYWSSLYTQENPNYGSYYHEALTVSSTRTAFRFAYSSSLPLGGCVVQISDGMGSDFVAVIVGDAGVYRQTTIKATGAFEGMRLGTYKTSISSTNRYYILNKKDNSTFFDSSTRVTYTVIGLGNDVNSYQACRLTSITISSTVTETRTWFEEIGGSQTPDMPEITPDILGQTRQYTGATDSTYTNGYFYKATGTEVNTPAVMATTITSPSGEATVDIDATGFIRNFCNWVGWSVAELERALINYAQQTWIINYSIDNAQVVEVYVPFYGWVGATNVTQCFAVTYTGSSSSGNVDINFTVAYTPAEHTVQDGAWQQIDVQPSSGGATYTAGNGISIDANNEISVTAPTLQNNTAQTDSVAILGTTDTTYGYNSVSIGSGSHARANSVVIGKNAGNLSGDSAGDSVFIGYNTKPRSSGLIGTVVIGANAQTGAYGIAIGGSANASGGNSIAIGSGATSSGSGSVKIGYGTTSGEESVAFGNHASVSSNYGIALGSRAVASAVHAIQIGRPDGVYAGYTNSDANTFKVGNANGNFEIMSADGTIPADRLTHAINKYSTMPTAASTNEGWIVQFTGTTDSTYTHGYLYECKAQGTDPETYAWEEVSLGGGSSLPSQTGQSGKFLTTDGTNASWSDKPLVNMATGTNSLAIGGTVSGSYGTAVGNGSTCSSAGVALGQGSSGGTGVALGSGTSVSGIYGVAIGTNAKITAANAIQITTHYTNNTNSDANTFKVGNANGNFEIMSADGTVPTARLTKVNTTATLAAADWSSNTQTVTVSGVKADSVVFVSPAPASASDYASAGILCTAQAADSLTFTCTTTPTNAITVNVVCL